MSELVGRVGVPAATIRYYLAEGLLPPPSRVAANRFLYDERHVEIIRIVRLFRERRRLPIDAIRRLLPELLPDLLGRPEGGVFRAEMWRQLLTARGAGSSRSPARERLVAAGLAAFSHHGFGEVSIDDVCRAAGIAKGSFYRSFHSKEDLFLAVAASVPDLVGVTLVEGGAAMAEPARLAAALAPYLTVLLELASLASQRRPGHGRALGELLGGLAEGLGVVAPERSEAERDVAVREAIALALVGAADSRAAVPTIAVALAEAVGALE